MVATYLILFHYNSIDRAVLPLFFPVRKFFDHEVQVLVGFLARPVTGYGAHDYAGTNEHGRDDQCNLHIKYICPVGTQRSWCTFCAF